MQLQLEDSPRELSELVLVPVVRFHRMSKIYTNSYKSRVTMNLYSIVELLDLIIERKYYHAHK